MPEWIAEDSVPNSDIPRSGRPWLGVHYVCAGTYGRVIQDASGTCYRVVCPKCMKRCTVLVGEGGTTSRMFEMKCSTGGLR